MLNFIIKKNFESISRPSLLFYTINKSSPQKSVEEWVSGNKKQDLIVSISLVNGYERDAVVNFTKNDFVAARSTALYHKIKFDYSKEYENVKDYLHKEHTEEDIAESVGKCKSVYQL